MQVKLSSYPIKRQLLLLLVLAYTCLPSQNLNQPVFHNIDPETFGVKRVTTALKSKVSDGMWLTTNLGLGYYNGYKTILYQHYDSVPNSPLSNNIFALFEEKSGKVWIGYPGIGAITSFDPKTETFTHFKHDSLDKKSYPNAEPSRYLEDSKGRLWVSTWGGGFLMFNKERSGFKVFTKEDQPNSSTWLKSNAVRDMLELEPNKILISYFQEQPMGYPGIFDVEKNTITPFPIDEYKGNLSDAAFGEVKHIAQIVHFFYHDKKYGKLWIGTYSGLLYIDLKNKTSRRVSPVKFNEDVFYNLDNTTEYIVDDQDRLWTSTANSGIMIVDLKTTKAFYHKNYANCSACVGDNLINGFTRDGDGNIWVSNGSRGLSVYSPFKQQFKLKEWTSLKAGFLNPSHQSMPLSQMLIRNNKTVYISNLNGISVYDYEKDSVLSVLKLHHEPSKHANIQNVNSFKLRGNKISFMSSQNHGWNSQPAEYDPATKQVTFANTNLYGFQILFPNDSSKRPTYFLRTGNTKLCYYGPECGMDTLYKFKPGLLTDYNYTTYLKNGKWFFASGNNGFLIFDSVSKKITRYANKGEYDVHFNDSLITNYYYNNKGTVWITTRNGIHSYDENTGKVVAWNKIMGLEPLGVFGLVEDASGNIWFTGTREFYKYDIKTKQLWRFNRTLGIPSFGFDHKNTLFTMVSDGDYVFFPTVKGLMCFSSKSVQLPQTKLILKVFNITVNDSALSAAKLADFLAGQQELPYNKNTFVFELSTNQLFTPSPTKFKYQLLGLSEKWVDNEISNKINLQNLPPGTYTLVVNCVNSYQVQSNDLKVVFTINKPFWKTWWFILILIGVLVVVVIYIIKSREKVLQKRQAELEKTVEERTQEVVAKAREISHQKELIEEKQKEIVDSIVYAQRIQRALLASKSLLDQHFKNYFVYYNPKAIVSGDFYWATAVNDKFYFIVADSTGHGVPGAFMSLLNISFLNEAINEKLIEKPGDILNHVRQRLIASLAEDGSLEGGQDGMDCSLICFDFKANVMQYACAHNPILVLRNGEMLELESDRMPVGKSPNEEKPFTNHTFQLETNDLVYVITDGYADQFGGVDGKKLKHKNLKKYLLELPTNSIRENEQLLSEAFNQWKGDLEQIDDVTVVGIKIG